MGRWRVEGLPLSPHLVCHAQTQTCSECAARSPRRMLAGQGRVVPLAPCKRVTERQRQPLNACMIYVPHAVADTTCIWMWGGCLNPKVARIRACRSRRPLGETKWMKASRHVSRSSSTPSVLLDTHEWGHAQNARRAST